MSRRFVVVGIFFCLGVLTLVRVGFYINGWMSQELPHYAGTQAEVVGTITNDPERRSTSTHVNIAVAAIDTKKVSGTMLVVLPREAGVAYGDTITVRGSISLPEAFETDTGRMFDYGGYLQVQGISTLIPHAQLLSTQKGGWSPQKFLFGIKHIFEESVESLFPEPDSSLLEGILLGERRGLPKNLNDAFITSGLVHVVVLSGYNISIVSESILRVTSFLPKTLNYGAGGVLMVLFALMSGGGATTVRALVMGLIAMLARYMKRPTDALRALCVAACGMALWNPPVVIHDPSFILSVLATFGLITLSPSVEKYFTWLPEKFGIRSIAASTVSVQFFVLPALLYFTGVFSALALPANVLALPIVPFAMLAGFLAGLAGFVHPMFAYPFTLIADLLLRWMMLVANTAHVLPLSFAVVPSFPVWVAVLIYVPLTWFATVLYRQNVSQSHSN